VSLSLGLLLTTPSHFRKTTPENKVRFCYFCLASGASVKDTRNIWRKASRPVQNLDIVSYNLPDSLEQKTLTLTIRLNALVFISREDEGAVVEYR
jgi:hypothetical protein